MENPDFEYESIKVRDIMVNNEFGSIVKVPFESFKENVLLNTLKKNDLQNKQE